MDKNTLEDIVAFVNKRRIHLICDEIYAATTFSSGPGGFVSVCEVVEAMDASPREEETRSCCDRDLIHIVYSLSKDMGLPGFRVGIIYSFNDAVVDAARRMSSFGLVSSQTQHMLAAMLSDDMFVNKFLAEVPKRVAQRHRLFTEGVARLGISCLKSNACLFVWMDLRHLLDQQRPSTLGLEEGELALWRLIINDVKINLSPGSSFHCSEPGWFRVCFANMDDDTTVEVALARIEAFFSRGNKENEIKAAIKKKSWPEKKNLRLSLNFMSRRRYNRG
ncbi:acetyl-coenzyme A synthetase 2 [Dionaea muscipula]